MRGGAAGLLAVLAACVQQAGSAPVAHDGVLTASALDGGSRGS